MKKITNWVFEEDCAYRHYVGTDGTKPENRVALIEKTPRVRIREYHLGVERGRWRDGEEWIERRWPEHLDWCYGLKGDGPHDPESLAWCDGMLKAIGYEL